MTSSLDTQLVLFLSLFVVVQRYLSSRPVRPSGLDLVSASPRHEPRHLSSQRQPDLNSGDGFRTRFADASSLLGTRCKRRCLLKLTLKALLVSTVLASPGLRMSQTVMSLSFLPPAKSLEPSWLNWRWVMPPAWPSRMQSICNTSTIINLQVTIKLVNP